MKILVVKILKCNNNTTWTISNTQINRIMIILFVNKMKNKMRKSKKNQYKKNKLQK